MFEDLNRAEVERGPDGLVGNTAYIKMYEISGQNPISEKGRSRYFKDKQQDSYIKDLAVDRFAPLQENIKSMSKNEVASLIKEGLSSHNNITFKLDAVSMIDFAPVE